MNKLDSSNFNIYSSFINRLNLDKEFSLACSTRENSLLLSKLKEYFMGEILLGDVAFETGCDIINSKIFPESKIEIKSTKKAIIPKKTIKNKYLSNRIIITHKFKKNNIIDLKSDILCFNFEEDKKTFTCNSKEIEPYISSSGSFLVFNTKNFEYISHDITDWKDEKPMNKTCALNLLKYCASPLPKEEYGSFTEYLNFCLNNNINHYKIAREYVLQ